MRAVSRHRSAGGIYPARWSHDRNGGQDTDRTRPLRGRFRLHGGAPQRLELSTRGNLTQGAGRQIRGQKRMDAHRTRKDPRR